MLLTEQQDTQLVATTLTGGEIFDVLIVGGGVAALSAALYASRDDFKTLVLEGTMVSSTDGPGGALLLTSEIENYPGFPAGAGGDLVETIRDQAEHFGADIREERVETLDASTTPGALHTVTTDTGETYKARTVILAMGAKARLLGVPGEEEHLGQGVSTCGTCDGFMFKDEKVVIVGGGDTACEDALLLTKYASHVTMLVRGDKLRSTGPEARIIQEHPNVTIMYNTNLESVEADKGKITHVVVSGKNDEGKNTIPVDGVFIAIGSDPASEFLNGTNIPLAADGSIPVMGGSTRVTGEAKGVYAAGDVSDRVYRQAITSAGKGAQAALEARAYLINPV